MTKSCTLNIDLPSKYFIVWPSLIIIYGLLIITFVTISITLLTFGHVTGSIVAAGTGTIQIQI